MKLLQQVQNSIVNAYTLSKEDKKYSYMIVKPNGEKHFSEIIAFIRNRNFYIEETYRIRDYEYVNLLLHPEKEKQKYIIPINQIYKDFYSNSAILILISKKNIAYEQFVKEIVDMKLELREKYDHNYIALALDVSKIGMPYNGETLKVISMSNVEVAKQRMNEKGSFLVISINEIHSPDSNIENTISELMLLFNSQIICEENAIPKETFRCIERYRTFSFLQDIN